MKLWRKAGCGLGAVVVVILVLNSCTDAVSPKQRALQIAGLTPAATLVQSEGFTRGALISEVVLDVSGNAGEGTLVLFEGGAIEGPVVIDFTGEVFLGSERVSLSDVVSDGFVFYYKLNGDLYMRPIQVPLFAVASDGSREYQQVPGGDPPSVAMESAPYGLKILWSISEEQFLGYNANSGGPPPSCALMLSWLCLGGPAIGQAPQTDGLPSGRIQIRAYRAQKGSPLVVSIEKKEPGMALPNLPGKRGTGRVELEVCVRDGSKGTPVPNQEVHLSALAVKHGGGHEHPDKPNGKFEDPNVSTGSGCAPAVYLAEEVSGPVDITGTAADARSATVRVEIGVAGLTQLAKGEDFEFVGNAGVHSRRFYGTPDLVDRLILLAAHFRENFPDARPSRLGFNDMSLPLGGLFDITAQWRFTGPRDHYEHRLGMSADLRTNIRTDKEREWIRRRWELKLEGHVKVHIGERAHFHLRYPKDARL